MMPESRYWLLQEGPLLILTVVCSHLAVSFTQTAMHRWLGHRRLGGFLFHNHINYHHTYYTRGHLASVTYRGEEGNNTPFFLIPAALIGGGLFFALPFELFLMMAAAVAASFYAHVFFDKEYHVEGSRFERFAWFRRKQQLHFVHHLHANSNFAVIDFFWDRLLGTFRPPDGEAH